MDNALDPFAPLTDAEIEAARLASPAPEEPGARLICPPADAESGAHAAARLYGRKPDAIWRYAMQDGETAFFAARWNEPGGKKEIRPVSWCEGEGWGLKAWPDHRPVYKLDEIAAAPNAPIVICEGEKAADAAARVFPQSIVTTSSGGANAAAKTDWAPLAGRRVLIWPDNDAAGAKYGQAVAQILHALQCDVSIIDAKELAGIAPDGSKREGAIGWDAADAVAEWQDLAALRNAAGGRAGRYEPGPRHVSWGDFSMTAKGLYLAKKTKGGTRNGKFGFRRHLKCWVRVVIRKASLGESG